MCLGNCGRYAAVAYSGSEGARKVRWTVAGAGKRGGVRVIYFYRTAAGLIYPVAIYRKSDQGNIRPADIPEIDA